MRNVIWGESEPIFIRFRCLIISWYLDYMPFVVFTLKQP